MKYYACDTSALSKRYHAELGSPFVIKLTDDILQTAPYRIVVTRLIVAEIVSVLKRRFNSQLMTSEQLAASLQSLNTDTAIMSGMAIDDDTIDAAHPIILRHNLNSSDAIFLYQCTQAAIALRQFGNELVLVASDSRLLRAASGEGLAVLNPETDADAVLIS